MCLTPQLIESSKEILNDDTQDARHDRRCIGCLRGMGAPGIAGAETPKSATKPILTISGKINGDAAVQFDRDALEALGTETIETKTRGTTARSSSRASRSTS